MKKVVKAIKDITMTIAYVTATAMLVQSIRSDLVQIIWHFYMEHFIGLRMYDVCPLYFFVDHGVSVLRGMLCFYSTYNDVPESIKGTFKLWIMKDYGPDQYICLRIVKCYYTANVHVGYFSSKFISSRGPFDLCPECDTTKRGIVYAESFISPSYS
ncbi:hypothetical protein H5410_064451 [Solanum commersonii]|uniref:Uncharacterized protein n=1 Tax=Solanum commersonii TaxID=4109 RepID=A0A9J5VZB2_SOLCO|nr:hypothetical protein H5410_064451 [Solanum commersonii]